MYLLLYTNRNNLSNRFNLKCVYNTNINKRNNSSVLRHCYLYHSAKDLGFFNPKCPFVISKSKKKYWNDKLIFILFIGCMKKNQIRKMKGYQVKINEKGETCVKRNWIYNRKEML